MTQIFFPNLVASELYSTTRYYTCFPLYKGFFILVVSNVSLWLLVVFSWLLFLSSFTRCMIRWRWHWVSLISRFQELKIDIWQVVTMNLRITFCLCNLGICRKLSFHLFHLFLKGWTTSDQNCQQSRPACFCYGFWNIRLTFYCL